MKHSLRRLDNQCLELMAQVAVQHVTVATRLFILIIWEVQTIVIRSFVYERMYIFPPPSLRHLDA